jgi:protein translocase SecG subunit
MAILFGFLSAFMFLNCIVLILLILVQVPKKEAGAGMAFGGSAADALFGAGSGNALTTITKYSAGIFFGVALLMAIMASHLTPSASGVFEDVLSKPGPAGSQPAAPLIPGTVSNGGILSVPSPTTPAPANAGVPAAAPNSAVPAAPASSSAPVKPAVPLEAPAPATNK